MPILALLRQGTQGVQVLEEGQLFRRQEGGSNVALHAVEVGPHRAHVDSRNGALVVPEVPDVVLRHPNKVRKVKAEIKRDIVSMHVQR